MASLRSGVPQWSRMDPAAVCAIPMLSTHPQQTQDSLHHTVHRPSVPAKLLQSRRQNVGFFLPLHKSSG